MTRKLPQRTLILKHCTSKIRGGPAGSRKYVFFLCFPVRAANRRLISLLRARQVLKAVTGNGKFNSLDVKAPQSLALKTRESGIAVTGLDSGDINLLTSNGAVKGSLPGKPEGYTSTSATRNGNIGLDFDAGRH